MIRKIEVDFAIPVELTDNEVRTICEIVNSAARRTETPEVVHWQSGVGDKPMLSQADARFLGKPVNDDAPESGEPTFDDSILYIETCSRERYEGE